MPPHNVDADFCSDHWGALPAAGPAQFASLINAAASNTATVAPSMNKEVIRFLPDAQSGKKHYVTRRARAHAPVEDSPTAGRNPGKLRSNRLAPKSMHIKSDLDSQVQFVKFGCIAGAHQAH
jgi:hypothetical protein